MTVDVQERLRRLVRDESVQRLSLPAEQRQVEKAPPSRSLSRPKQKYRGGSIYGLPKAKYQAIYRIVGNAKEAITWMDDIHTWRTIAEEQGSHSSRPDEDDVFLSWAEEVDLGKAVVNDRIESQIQKIMDARPRWKVMNLMAKNIGLGHHLADARIAGEKVQPVEIAYANNAVGVLASAHNNLKGSGPTNQFNFNGKMQFVTPPNPQLLAGGKAQALGGGKKKPSPKTVAEPFLEGEYKVV